MERKLQGKYFRKFWVCLARFSPFWTFWKKLLRSLLEVAENSNRKFRSNGKRPICLPVSPLLPSDFRANFLFFLSWSTVFYVVTCIFLIFRCLDLLESKPLPAALVPPGWNFWMTISAHMVQKEKIASSFWDFFNKQLFCKKRLHNVLIGSKI